MTRDISALARALLTEWLPGFQIRRTPHQAADALLLWQGPRGRVRYLLEFKNHLPQHDIQVLAHRLEGLARTLPKMKATTKPFLFAPYVPPKQAEFLRGRGIDYADEVGNAHLQVPGALVHVEGRRPDAATKARSGITKGWVKVTLAGLLDPTLFEGPYHRLAAAAGVTPPTVMTCLRDLDHRGLLDAHGRRRRLIGRAELLPLWSQGYVNTLRPRLRERRFRMLTTNDSQETLERLKQVLNARVIPWCLAGAAAALELTHYYQTDVTEIYAAPELLTDAVARELKAQPTTGEANLVVIEPPIPGIVPDIPGDTVTMAPALLVYGELRCHGTGQANEAAALLLPMIEGHNGPTH